jgi:hypothetical protein
MKFYTSTSEKTNVNNYIEKLHQKEIALLNKNFHIDNNEVSDSISSSIKYLMKKKERENNNKNNTNNINNNININNIIKSKIDYNDIISKKISEHNNFNFNKFIKNDDAIKYSNFDLRNYYNNNNINNIDLDNDLLIGKNEKKTSINCDIEVINKEKKLIEKKNNNNNIINNINNNYDVPNMKGKKKLEKVNKKSLNVKIIEKNLDEENQNENENDFDKEELEKELLLNF